LGAEHREPVCIDSGALHDPRFRFFKNLPEDSFEAFLSVPIIGQSDDPLNEEQNRSDNYTVWHLATVRRRLGNIGSDYTASGL
jgi:hypothetical protein